MAASGYTGYAITANGSLWTWNLANLTPVMVAGLPPVQSVAISVVAENMVLALDANGTPWCVRGEYPRAWGFLDRLATLGVSTASAPPRMIGSLTNIVDIAATRSGAYALDAAGALWAWGRNDSHTALGLGDVTARAHVPQQVPLNAGNLARVETPSTCAGSALSLMSNSVATLGSEIILVPFQTSGAAWLFLAPGPAEVTPWFPLGPCGSFLSPTGLQAFVNLGIGPIPPAQVALPLGGTSRFWLFSVPNDPGIRGMTFTAQMVEIFPPLPVSLSSALTFSIG